VIGMIATVFDVWLETLFIAIGFIHLSKIAGGYHTDTLLTIHKNI
jgi:hypothetical protein